MSRRKKGVYLALIAVAACALVVDRCVLSESVIQPGVAVALEAGSAPARPSAHASQGSTLPPIPELPFPRGLEPFDPRSPMRDPFAPPESIAASRSPSPQPDGGAIQAAQARTDSVAFLARHRVSGVVLYERLRIAIVDGAWLRIGESLDGCRLTSVSGNEARFACYDGEALLTVTDAPGPADD